MNDTQRTAVLAAIAETDPDCTPGSPDLLRQACQFCSILTPRREPRVSGHSVSPGLVGLSTEASALTTLHVAAHLATPRVFPAHGAEFCERLVALTDRFLPYHATMLRHGLEAHGCHVCADDRRRAVLKGVIQRATDGTEIVEAVFDDPPESATGRLEYARRDRAVLVGGKRYPLQRLRYLSKVS